jgi:cyclase
MKRLAPSLVIDERGTWVTQGFKRAVYLGEPSNAVRIFNELMADELSVSWIGEDHEARNRSLRLISSQASMPLTYGGGISNAEQAQEIIRMGFERVALTSTFIDNPAVLGDISLAIGRSSVLARVPVSRQDSGYALWDWREGKSLSIKLIDLIRNIDLTPIGEFVAISVGRNGSGLGPDLELAEKISSLEGVQRGYEGGVDSTVDVEKLWSLGIDVVYSSSMLMIYGKYGAPMMDYPQFRSDRYK